MSAIKSTASPLILGRSTDPAPKRPFGFTDHSTRAPTGALRGLVTYGGDSHLMTFGSTGSGKTAGPVISNALSHPGQLIVFDCKGDVLAATSRRRRELGQQVHVLDLRDGNSAQGSLNPLHLARRCGGEIAVVARSYAAQVVARLGTERDPFWNDWAETMLTGGIAWLLTDRPAPEQNMSALFDLFNHEDPVYHIATLLDDKSAVRQRCARTAFVGLLSLPERETRPSVLASTQQHLRCWDSDLIRRVTSTTSFDLDALIAGEPMSLYIVVPPYRMEAYRPLLRLWFAGLLSVLMQREYVPETRTLLLCDETASFGKVDAFVTAATLMRSSGVQLWSFWQNPSQLEIYGSHARTLVDNSGVLQLLGAPNRRMAQEFAALVGGIDADEIMGMSPQEQVVLIDGGKPRRLRRIRYFEEPMFSGQYDAVKKPRAQPHQPRLPLSLNEDGEGAERGG